MPDVVQKFAADNADYLKALNENRDAIKGEVVSLEEHQRAIERNNEVVAKFASQLGDMQRKLSDAKRTQDEWSNSILSGDRMGSMADTMQEVSVMLDQIRAKTQQIEREGSGAGLAESADKARASYEALNKEMSVFRGNLRNYDMAAAFEQQAAAGEKTLAQYQALKKETADYYSMLDGYQRSANLRGTSIRTMGDNVAYTVGHMRELNGLLTGLTAAQRVSGGGDGGGSIFGGILGGGAFVPGGGRSLADVLFGGAKGTLAGTHMAVMLTMEVASQIIPAAVAAAAAAAVGTQGAVAAFQRGTGIYNTGEALGGAYGLTPGDLFGMGSGYQVAQNQATGGVYGIIGNLMRMASQGTGQGSILGPGGMGVQTVAMIDRGIANMVANGRGAQLSNALGGGTGALQNIGDIFGNLGDTLLNLAPVLPGMGSVLFGGLKAGTGALRSITGLAGGGGLWPLAFGTGLAAEAGFRWGGPLLSGGKLPWFLGGGQFGGAAGLAQRLKLGTIPRAAAAADVTAGLAGAEGETIAGTGLAGFLGAGAAGLSTAGIAAIIAASAYGISQGTFGTPAANQMGGYMRSINASFGAGSLTPIKAALYQAAQTQKNLPGVSYETVGGGAAAGGGGGALGWLSGSPGYAQQRVAVGQPIAELMRVGYSPSQALAKIQAEYGANTQNVANQLGQMTASAPQAQKALESLGIKGASLAQAMDYMTMAMISPKDVGPGGKLDSTAMNQLAGFIGTYSLMSGGPGSATFTAGHVRALQPSISAITSAAGADYVMATPQIKSLSQINSALDSMTAIMTGGAASASALALAGLSAAAGVPTGAINAKTGAPITMSLGKALAQGPFTATGAAAWQAMTNAQTGIIPLSQQNMDQLRTFMTIGGMSGPQAAQLGAFELKQSVLPYAKQSPMALAMLQQQAMQAGVPGVMIGQSYAQTQRAINAHAGTMQQANQLLTQGTQAAANIPGVAAFLNPNANISPLMSAQYAQMAQTAITTAQHPTKANVSALTSLVGMVAPPGQVKVGVDAILQNLHVPSNIIAKVNAQIGSLKVPTGAAGTVTVKSKVDPIHVPPVPDKFFQIRGQLHMPAIPRIPDQSFTITGHVVIVGGGNIGTGGGAFTAGSGHTMHGQKGFKVPGWGGGDIFPAMLEPGELVVPKHMVPSLQPFLGGKIPGFQGGGLAVPDFPGVTVGIRSAFLDFGNELIDVLQQGFASLGRGGVQTIFGGGPFGPHPFGGGGSSGPVPTGSPSNPIHVIVHDQGGAGAVGELGSIGAKPIPAAAMKIIDAFEKTFKGMGNPWGKFASDLLQGLLDNLKNPSKETAKMAQALVNKVAQEVQFGKSTAASMVAGLNLGGMTGLPQPTLTQQQMIDQQTLAGGGTVSVQGQMGDYLSSLKSFSSDFGKLARGHLNKDLLKQILAAGPVQGDALAQSILGGQGGVGSANKIYKQIQQQANALGISAAQDIYGPIQHGKSVRVDVQANAAPVHALQSAINSLHGKTVTITVNVVESGGGGGGGGKLNKAQLKTVGREVQSYMLQQAKMNRKTGLQLPGYGS